MGLDCGCVLGCIATASTIHCCVLADGTTVETAVRMYAALWAVALLQYALTCAQLAHCQGFIQGWGRGSFSSECETFV